MGDPFNKVKSGDSLAIPAAAYNAFVDAARAHRDGQLGKGGTVTRSTSDSGVIYVKNYTGAALSRFDAVGFHEGSDSGTYPPPFTPDNNLESFQNTPTLNVYDLFRSYNDGDGDQDSRGRFAIVLEPIPFEGIGRACISGVCVAQINVINELHRYADAVAVGSSLLWSDDRGAAQILWKEQGTGTKWAVLRLGIGDIESVQFGKVVQYTQGAGSLTVNPCDYRGYDVNTSAVIDVRVSRTLGWSYYSLTRTLAVGDIVAFQHLYTEIYSPNAKYAILIDPQVEDLVRGGAAADAVLDSDIGIPGIPLGYGPCGGTVDVHPYVGGAVDETITLNVKLPAIGAGSPNVRAGHELLFRASDLVCVSPYMDDCIGTIRMWAGGTSGIPAGWALCNGENDTVNLSGRFVVSVGNADPENPYSPGYYADDTGGYNWHGKSNSGGIDENNHGDHTIPGHGQNFKNTDSGSMEVLGSISSTHPTLTHSNTDNRPPYYALAFIQRVN